jgi:electron transport complex protein RnfC
VHPAEHKASTAALAIRQFPFAPLITVPLRQHLGAPAVPLAKRGQWVDRGAQLARAMEPLAVALHAPVSGTIRELALVAMPNGSMTEGYVIETSPDATQEVIEGTPCPSDAEPEAIVRAIQEAGIVGLGGAAFPTHAKLIPPAGVRLHTLIVNGVECEPYLTTDHRVMLEQTADIITGIRYLLQATGATRAVIGVEANKLDAAAALRSAIPSELPLEVQVVAVKYPQGAEKMLIAALLGREVPSGGLPSALGVVSVNVATAAEIGRLLPHGRGIQERVVTIGGPAVARPGNYRVPIGTPLSFVFETVGLTAPEVHVVLGGPMMGGAVSSLAVPILKGTSGVLAFPATAPTARSLPCIRCGDCLDACPLSLNPSELGRLAAIGDHQGMADDFHLFDCFECGACSYVCPSRIPLTEHFRVAKGALRRTAGRRAAAGGR